MLSVGDKVLGRYEVTSVLGARPLGVLYRAIDLERGVDVALRLIAPRLAPDAVARETVVQKLGRSRALEHANLVKLYDVVTDHEQVIVSVQWAPGETLAERLERGPLSPTELRPFVKQVTAAVAHAHQHGIVLGDLRAETVVVLDGTLKLSNVGIGPALPRTHYLEAMRDTPVWPRLPPELRAGGTAEPRGDVWSLAALTVELLTGRPPSLPLVIADAPPSLVPVLERALAADPLVRQPTVEALGHELDLALSGDVLLQRSPVPARDSQRTPLLPTLPPLPTPPPSRSDDSVTSELPRLDEDETRPGDPHGERTRVVDDQELDRLRGAEVTRVVSEEEIFPLRVQSSETQQIDLDMIVPPEEADDYDELELEPAADPEGTVRSPAPTAPPAEPPPTPKSDSDEHKTDQVILLEADAARTVPVQKTPVEDSDSDEQTAAVPRTEPELPEPPPPIPVEQAPPAMLSQLASSSSTSSFQDRPTPLPPPAPAPPSASPHEDEFGDESQETNQVPRLSAADRAEQLRPRSRELVVPDQPRKPDAAALPKIQVEIPVEKSGPAASVPPPAPPSASPPFPPAAPSSSTPPRTPRPVRSTLAVEAMPPPQRFSMGLLVLFLGFLLLATAIAIGVVHHMQALRREHDRIEKQQLADRLKAEAEALKHAPVSPTTNLAPLVTHPDVGAGALGPCPLGSNLVDGRQPYCVDVYEYPGGKTIPRTGVSFDDAQRLCASRGERLCNDYEWERACRGKGGASYPYGQAFDPVRCNVKSGQIAPAGDFKECRSGSGAYDMSGNVAEWVVSRGQPALKGGAANGAGPGSSRCSQTQKNVAPEGGVFVGFRCCADPRR